MNLENITNPLTVIMIGTTLLGIGVAAYEFYRTSDIYKSRVARNRIKKRLPPYDDRQFYLDFMKDYI